MELMDGMGNASARSRTATFETAAYIATDDAIDSPHGSQWRLLAAVAFSG